MMENCEQSDYQSRPCDDPCDSHHVGGVTVQDPVMERVQQEAADYPKDSGRPDPAGREQHTPLSPSPSDGVVMVATSCGVLGTGEPSLRSTCQPSGHSARAGSGERIGLGKCHLFLPFALFPCKLPILAPETFWQTCQLFGKKKKSHCS